MVSQLQLKNYDRSQVLSTKNLGTHKLGVHGTVHTQQNRERGNGMITCLAAQAAVDCG